LKKDRYSKKSDGVWGVEFFLLILGQTLIHNI
jgi:hypothetical protein